MLTKQFLVRINYRSGISEEFWVKNFTYTPGQRATWDRANYSSPYPHHLGIDDIESVWVVKTRWRL